VPPLIAIVGETASGKSALAMELAEKFNGELICADSWTVYKDFDIGTAKPSPLQRATVPHHLLDIADAHGGFNTVLFQKLAESSVASITARGRLPILVGGTGLYVDSVLYHYEFLPAPPAGIREQLNKLSLEDLIHKAQHQDLDTSKIDARNKRRVIRLIENNGILPGRSPIRSNTLVIGLNVPRDQLLERVTMRVDNMLLKGLEYEVQRLAIEYGWDSEPMKGIGYHEWHAYFEGTQDLGETRAKIIKATMQLAKRQRTWFKRNYSIQWLDDRSNAVEIVTTFLNK
jgi:tRNA dimethylallyltransferase